MKSFINKFSAGFLALAIMAASLFAVAPLNNAYAACNTNNAGNTGIKSGVDCAKSDDQKADLGNVFKTVTNVLLFLIGAIAVIMIIYGGIRYTISGGDSTQVTNAKNTILYAVIGIVVALLAYAIVNFVIDSFVK